MEISSNVRRTSSLQHTCRGKSREGSDDCDPGKHVCGNGFEAVEDVVRGNDVKMFC